MTGFFFNNTEKEALVQSVSFFNMSSVYDVDKIRSRQMAKCVWRLESFVFRARLDQNPKILFQVNHNSIRNLQKKKNPRP